MKIYINKKYIHIMDEFETYSLNGDTFILGQKTINKLKYNSFAPMKLYHYKFSKHHEVGIFLDSLEKLSIQTYGVNLEDYEEIIA